MLLIAFIGAGLVDMDFSLGALIVPYLLFCGLSLGISSLALMCLDGKSAHGTPQKADLNSVLLPLAWLAIGMILGKLLPLPDASDTLLLLLLFLVGLDLGYQRIDLVRTLFNYRALVASFAFMISVLLSGILAAKILGWHWRLGASMVAGFGWYSLSGAMIGKAYGGAMGALALAVDLTREMVALLFVGVMMKKSQMAAVALGGATSLDVALPSIIKAGGKDAGALAISFGLWVNIGAPVTLGLLLSI